MMEERFQLEVTRLKQQIESNLRSQAIAKGFIERLGTTCSTKGALRFDDHAFALASRVLTHLVCTYFRACVDNKEKGNWFPPRAACNEETETALGALFKVMTWPPLR
jgi:hypothetical protein